MNASLRCSISAALKIVLLRRRRPALGWNLSKHACVDDSAERLQSTYAGFGLISSALLLVSDVDDCVENDSDDDDLDMACRWDCRGQNVVATCSGLHNEQNLQTTPRRFSLTSVRRRAETCAMKACQRQTTTSRSFSHA